MWGVYWLPLLYLESLGMDGALAGFALHGFGLIILVPMIVRYWQLLVSQWRLLVISGVLAGFAFSLYSTSLVYTDVIRAILLFYLTPVWGILIGLMVLGERFTRQRAAVICLAFVGLYVILGKDTGLPIPRNLGDSLALLSGLFWAVGTYGLLRAQSVPVMAQLIAFLFGGTLLSGISAFVIGDLAMSNTAQSAPYTMIAFLGVFAIYLVPMCWLTIAPARVLTPARVGILLMSEVVIGALSAAFFSGQPFGIAEVIGTVLIITAGLIEVNSAGPKAETQKAAS